MVGKTFFQIRAEKGYFKTTFPDLKNDPEFFYKYTRMDLKTFNHLLQLTEPHIIILKKRSDGITPEERLAIVIRYLASGDDIFSLAVAHRVSGSTIREIIESVCKAFYAALQLVYLKPPNRVVWRNIAKGFKDFWNLPNYVGAIDGQHIAITCPAHSGSLYYNYKGFYSLVLLAMCDHTYQFTLVDVGAYGSESDAGVFRRSEIGKAYLRKELDVPVETPNLPLSNINTPYFFVGDNAFALATDMMTPFSGHKLTYDERIFNYRLSRARRCIENAFGILVARWRVLLKPIGFNPTVAKSIIYACVCLHNFLMCKSKQSKDYKYIPDGYVDRVSCNGTLTEGAWRNEGAVPNNLEGNNRAVPEEMAKRMRDTLKKYFRSPQGRIPWQDDFVNLGRFGESSNY